MFVGHEPTPRVLQCGVPQGSVLGPLLFALYTHPLRTAICQSGLSYHFFADDSQIHKSVVPSEFPVLVLCLKDCIEDAAEWMGDRKLKKNGDKRMVIKLSLWSSLALPLCPSLVAIYRSLSLLETLVFTEMKRCLWMQYQIFVPHFVLSVAQNWKNSLLPVN